MRSGRGRAPAHGHRRRRSSSTSSDVLGAAGDREAGAAEARVVREALLELHRRGRGWLVLEPLAVDVRSSSANSDGKRNLSDRSASSLRKLHMPRRWASGAKISSVSRAMEMRLCGGMNSSVRMLCSRSASFTMTMRQSSAIATNIDRRFSTCSSCLLKAEATTARCVSASRVPLAYRSVANSERTIFGSFDTFVSPSTMRRTSTPKRRSTASKVSAVSSTVSCSRRRPTRNQRLSARMDAPAHGCVMKLSPLRRRWPRWAR